MRQSIARWPSLLFYGNLLKNAPSVKDLTAIQRFPWPKDNTGVSFVHCEGEGSRHGHAFWNVAECTAIQTLITNMLDAGIPAKEIGVITLYDGQRQRLRRRLDAGIEVKTLTRFKDERSRSL